MLWLLGRRSQVSIGNKVLIYNQVIKPIWMYGMQLWGCAKKSNINIIQRCQNKILSGIVNAPWYIRDKDLHRDLRIPTVEDEIGRAARSHKNRLHEHINSEVHRLIQFKNIKRRLKRTKPHDLA